MSCNATYGEFSALPRQKINSLSLLTKSDTIYMHVAWTAGLLLAQHLQGIEARSTDGRRQRSCRRDAKHNQNYA